MQNQVDHGKSYQIIGTQEAKRFFTEEKVAELWDDYNGQAPNGPTEPHEFTGYSLMLIYTGMHVIDERYIIGSEKIEAGRDREIPISKSTAPIVKIFMIKIKNKFLLKNIWKFHDDFNATSKRLETRFIASADLTPYLLQ